MEDLAIGLFKATLAAAGLCGRRLRLDWARVLRSQPQIGVTTEHAVARSGLARRDVLFVMGILCWWRGAALQRRGRAPVYGYLDWYCLSVLMLGGGGFALYKAATGTFPPPLSVVREAATLLPPSAPVCYSVRLIRRDGME